MPPYPSGTASAAAPARYAAEPMRPQPHTGRRSRADSAVRSDHQHTFSAYSGSARYHDDDDDREEEDSDTDSTGNHRHLEATPARALSSHEHRKLDRAQQQRPFSTATLDGINISHAVHWLANRQLRPQPLPQRTEPSPLPMSRGAAASAAATTAAPELRSATQPREPVPHQQLHGTPFGQPIMNRAPNGPTSAPPVLNGARPSRNMPSALPTRSILTQPQHAQLQSQTQGQQLTPLGARRPEPPLINAAAAPLPVPVPMQGPAPAPTVTSARLPDISGLTSAMGTPARPLHAFHHIPVDPEYPEPRQRQPKQQPLSHNLAPVPPPARPHTLDLRARVETDEDSDEDSHTGESESVAHFPLASTKANLETAAHQVGARHPNAIAAAAATQASTSAASDSHPRLWLQGMDHPKNQLAKAAEEAARNFGVEWNGPRPPLSAANDKQRQANLQQARAEEQLPNDKAGSMHPSPGDSTAKLQHMHQELAKIVDRLGRLEGENAPLQPTSRRDAGRHRPIPSRETDSSGNEAGGAGTGGSGGSALSRGAIKDMQAHMRELMREMQRQRKALGALVELEQDSVLDDMEAGAQVRKTLGLPAEVVDGAAAAVAAGAQGRRRRSSEEEERATREDDEGRRGAASPSAAVRQPVPQRHGSPPASWEGDAFALHDRMDDVMQQVYRLRDEVERGMPPHAAAALNRQAASSPVPQVGAGHEYQARPSSPFLRQAGRDAGMTQSSPPPVQPSARGSAKRTSAVNADDDLDVSRIAAERAAEAFAKVDQYARRERVQAPSPPTSRIEPVERRVLPPSDRYVEDYRGYNDHRYNTYNQDAQNADRGPSNAPQARTSRTEKAVHHLEHDEQNCSVCQAPIKAAQRREARRERVRREDREDRRRRAGSDHADTEEEEVLIDMLVEEAERHRQASGPRQGRPSGRRSPDSDDEDAGDPFATWRDLIVLSPAQQASLTRMVKQHMDEFIHQRMLYAELADELKGVHPSMSAVRRKILGEHVMEAVELLEIKAERINVLQRLLGDGPLDKGQEQEGREARADARRRSPPRRTHRREEGATDANEYAPRRTAAAKPAVSSKLRHQVEPNELASDYSDAEDEEREDVSLHAAARLGQRLLRRRSTSPAADDEPNHPQLRDQPPRPRSSTSSATKLSQQSGKQTETLSAQPAARPGSRTSRTRRAAPMDYSPPTTLGARELAVDLERERGAESELGSDEDDDDGDEYARARGRAEDGNVLPSKGKLGTETRPRGAAAFGGFEQGRVRNASSGPAISAFGLGRRTRA